MTQIQAEQARAAFITRWARIAGRFFAFQLSIQGINFLSGMVAVWSLPPHEYALVTMAVTLLGTMTTLSNLGISIGITSIGGKVHADRVRFGALVRTGLRLRHTLALVALPATAVALVASLSRAHASTAQIVTITILVLISAALELTTSQYSAVLMLRDRIEAVQRLDFVAAVLRLCLVAALYAGDVITASSMLAVSLVATCLRRWQISKRVAAEVDLTAAEVPEDRREMLRLIRLEGPNALFFCFQGQISLWIFAYFGAVRQIAEFGALGRLALVVSLLSSFFSSVLVQRFARIQDADQLPRTYATVLGLAVATALTVVAAVWALPGPVLWALGPHYHALTAELPLMTVQLMLGFVTGVVWFLNASRAWITVMARGSIACTVLTQIALAMVLDLRTLSGVIVFSMLSLLPNLTLSLCDSYLGLRAALRRPAPAV